MNRLMRGTCCFCSCSQPSPAPPTAIPFKTAEALFEKAIQVEPESRLAYLSTESLYMTQNRLAEAEQALRTALTKQTFLTPARIYHYLGRCIRKLATIPQL